MDVQRSDPPSRTPAEDLERAKGFECSILTLAGCGRDSEARWLDRKDTPAIRRRLSPEANPGASREAILHMSMNRNIKKNPL